MISTLYWTLHAITEKINLNNYYDFTVVAIIGTLAETMVIMVNFVNVKWLCNTAQRKIKQTQHLKTEILPVESGSDQMNMFKVK